MDLGSLFLILAVVLLVGVYVSRPFFQPGGKKRLVEVDSAAQDAERQRSALLAERDRIILALQELDFDQVLGKIPPEDYPEQRAALLQGGADVLRRLDSLGELEQGTSAEDRLEAAVAARRVDAVVKSVRHPSIAGEEDEVEALVTARRKARLEKAGGFCPKCGKPVTKTDQFCSRCGAVIS